MVLQTDGTLERDERREAGPDAVSREPSLRRRLQPVLAVLTSLELTIASLAALMLLVALCTLAQSRLGLLGAVEAYIRSFLVWAEIPGTKLSVPVFPGGGLVGLVLLANLLAAQFFRLERSRRKLGMWLVHVGLALLFAGEFVTAFFQREMRMAISQGQTLDFVESPRDVELAVIDKSDAQFDQVYAVPARTVKRQSALEHESWPFALVVKRYFANARIEQRQTGEPGPASIATAGIGPQLIVMEGPRSRNDDQPDQPAAFVEAVSGDRSYGTWLLSTVLGAEQGVSIGGKEYLFALRHKREYLPFTLTLEKFRRELHPGTEIPRHFSSRVTLRDPERKEDREVLISMNQPLRYGGRAFYQSGFDQNDTVSILQVVKNPGWLLPYVSCLLVGLGLLIHFAGRFAPAQAAGRLS